MKPHLEFKRSLNMPKQSFFLFGPRSTGKSTWLLNQLKPDLYIDLLKSKVFLQLSKNPEYLSELIAANDKIKIVVIDEIQKIPTLLDEVHSLIFEYGKKIQFILTGSSARKLKKSHANLLAGRALVRHFSPLTSYELGKKFNIDRVLKFGLLPQIWSDNYSDIDAIDYLYSYVETYLKEEIQQEALTRNLPAYAEFLHHLALRNTQVINLQKLSQEIGVARTTLKGYLDILEDTLIGISLQPIHLKAKVKEVATPKFYFFDTGVARALAQYLHEPVELIKGSQLETYILHELMTFSNNFGKHWQFYYWGTPTESEVDFIVVSGKSIIGIEVKSAKSWSKEFNKGLNILLEEKKIKKAYGIYLGNDLIKKDHTQIIPAQKFGEYLIEHSEEFMGSK